MATAKPFWYGRSQAVRLPKEFRFEGDEANIHAQRSSTLKSFAVG
jgi:antitoxin VapB